MKKREFQKLIKEEVYKTLQDILPKLLSEVVAEKLIDDDDTISLKQNIPTKQIQRESHGSNNPKKKIFSEDSPIGQILNETEGGISGPDQMVQLDGNFEMNSDGIPLNENTEHEVDEYSSGDHGQKISHEELKQIDPGLANIFKKDFTQLMKAVDKKKQNQSPSNIDFSKL